MESELFKAHLRLVSAPHPNPLTIRGEREEALGARSHRVLPTHLDGGTKTG